VCWTPPNLNDDDWPGTPQDSDALPGLERVLLAWAMPSEAIHLMAAWASVKIVIRSGVVCLREADSSALARAAQSAP